VRLSVDHALCVGHAMCVLAAPDLFALNEDEKSEPIVEVVPPAQEQGARDAELLCPENAITIVE
jgi:ferredoxin